MILIVDSNVLVVAANARAARHAEVIKVLSAPRNELIVPALCVAEACFLIARDFGSPDEAKFLLSLRDVQVESPTPGDFERMAELVLQYRDFPLGGTDASIIALAERLGADRIATFDRRHFHVVRPKHVPAFRLLP